jgi:hypothetical protein
LKRIAIAKKIQDEQDEQMNQGICGKWPKEVIINNQEWR